MKETTIKILTSILKKIASAFAAKTEKKIPEFYKNIQGVVHVGANTGQEAKIYSDQNWKVLWVEPIPEIFEQLQSNIKNYPQQKAIKALITDVDNKEYSFNLANNNGESSSILDMKLHEKVWPSVTFENKIQLRSSTLPTLFKDNQLNISNYDFLVMDTQGSELLVLKGAISMLSHFKYIKTEVSDFESYAGGSTVTDMESFLSSLGFHEYSRNKFAGHPQYGNYYDIVYINKKFLTPEGKNV